MKISMSFDFDTAVPSDVLMMENLLKTVASLTGDSLAILPRSKSENAHNSYDTIWRQLGAGIIGFALRFNRVAGDSDRIPFEAMIKVAGFADMSERSISSNIGRCTVIAKKYGVILFSVKREKTRRFITFNEDARAALSNLLDGPYGKDYYEEFPRYS